jgi:hypothetical protein
MSMKREIRRIVMLMGLCAAGMQCERQDCSRFPGFKLGIEFVNLGNETFEVTPSPASDSEAGPDDRAQLMGVACQDNIYAFVRERSNQDQCERFLHLCSLVDDYRAEVLSLNLQHLEDGRRGVGSEHNAVSS